MSKHQDAQIIQKLGGPTRVADLLGLSRYGGVQRVQNWTIRGIPSHVKVSHPALFMPHLVEVIANTSQTSSESAAST